VLAKLGGRVGERVQQHQTAELAAHAEDDAAVGHAFDGLSNHVVLAGFGGAARRLARVLEQARLPFAITTLSPDGAREAEQDGYPVLRGDATRLRTLQLIGAERAKMLVVADDDPATARRIAAVARTLNPTMRIVVRTRHLSEIDALGHVGADVVISEELESIVQLFGEVLRGYRVDPAEVEAYEEVIRARGYRALEARSPGGPVLQPCELNADCLDTRSVTVRAGTPAAGRTPAELDLARSGLELVERRRNGRAAPHDDVVLLAGDTLVLRGSSDAFAASAPLFRAPETDSPAPEEEVVTAMYSSQSRSRYPIDLERVYRLAPRPDTSCTHFDRTAPVTPSARGCEECLALGNAWVHLRLCMTCGHVGCCDSSKNKHATKHFHATTHPIVRSLEPGEDWAWCYEDETFA
jgi:CPA2 family monovalent cation:H+ antiporter-2